MPELTIFAIDNSGSTGGEKEYWGKVTKLLKEADPNTQCIFWNSGVPQIVAKAKAIDIAERKHGTGATDPSTFIPVLYQALENNELPINLILITDGQIAPSGNPDNKEQVIACIAECDKLLKEKKAKFSELKVYFVYTGGGIDLSVAAPFLRKADNYSYEYPEKIEKEEIKLITKLESELLKQDFKSITPDELEARIKEKFKSIAEQEPKAVIEHELLIKNLQSDLIATLKPNLTSKFKLIIQQRFKQIIDEGFLLVTEQGSRLDLNIYYGKPQKFLDNISTIEKQLEDQSLGVKNQVLIDGLTHLRENFLKLCENKEIENNKSFFDKIKSNLKEQGKEGEVLEELDKKIEQEKEKSGPKKNALKKIEELIIKAEKGYSLSLNTSTANRRRRAEEDETEEETINGINLDKVECKSANSKDEPFTLKIGKFVVHLKEGEPILQAMEKRSQDYYLNHPLAILNNKDLRKSISDFLMKIEVIHQPNQKFDENNYRSLCKIFSGTRKLCIPFSYALAILYFTVEDSISLRKDLWYPTFVKSLEDYMLSKLENEYVSVRNLDFKMPASLIIFYDASKGKLETTYYFKILDKLGYCYDEKAKHQYAIKKNLYWMYDSHKKKPQELEYWISQLTGKELELSDSSKVILDANLSKEELDVPRIPLQKSLSNPHIELNNAKSNESIDDSVYYLSIREILGLNEIILKNKDTPREEILMLKEISSLNEGIEFCNYSPEENNQENILKHKTSVCITLYPWTQDPASKEPWNKTSQANYGPLEKQIHLHKLFHDYVKLKKKFPTTDDKYCDFITFLSKKQAKRGINMLPFPILAMIDKLMSSYINAVKELLGSSKKIIDKLKEKVGKDNFVTYFETAKRIYEEKKDSFILDDFPVELFMMISKANQFVSNREVLQKLVLSSQMMSNSANIQKDNGHYSDQKNEEKTQAMADNDCWLRTSSKQADDSHYSAQKNEEKTQAMADNDCWLRTSSKQADDSHYSAQKNEAKIQATTDKDIWLRTPSNEADDSWLRGGKERLVFFNSPLPSNQEDKIEHSAIQSNLFKRIEK